MATLLLALVLALQPGDRLQIAGLVCTELAPWQHMAEVAATSSPEIARLFLHADMHRLDQCAVIPRPVPIVLGERVLAFSIGHHRYTVFAARVERTDQPLFIAVRVRSQGVKRPDRPSVNSGDDRHIGPRV